MMIICETLMETENNILQRTTFVNTIILILNPTSKY